jgi:hypothetical protein
MFLAFDFRIGLCVFNCRLALQDFAISALPVRLLRYPQGLTEGHPVSPGKWKPGRRAGYCDPVNSHISKMPGLNIESLEAEDATWTLLSCAFAF